MRGNGGGFPVLLSGHLPMLRTTTGELPVRLKHARSPQTGISSIILLFESLAIRSLEVVHTAFVYCGKKVLRGISVAFKASGSMQSRMDIMQKGDLDVAIQIVDCLGGGRGV